MQVEKIKQLMKEAVRCELDCEPEFAICDLKTLAKTYNGCGPDWIPARLRVALTYLFHFFEPAFLIHDWDYTYLPKDVKHFDKANNRLFLNCVKLVHARVAWWRIFRRLELKHLCIEIYNACDEFGFAGYMEAKQPNE